MSASLRDWLYFRSMGLRISVGLFLLRLVVGAAFIFHGWPKIQNPLGWMGPQATVPGFFQMLAALSEFGGGFSLILGLLIPIAALGIASTMTVALATVHFPRGDPFVNSSGGPSFELAAVYLATMLMFLAAGPGKFSLDAILFSGQPKNTARGGPL